MSSTPKKSLMDEMLGTPSKQSRDAITKSALALRARVIELTVSGQSSVEIAQSLGVATQTVRKILSEPSVRRKLDRMLDALPQAALAKMKAASEQVADRLIAIATDESGDVPVNVQLSAARDILDRTGARIKEDAPQVQTAISITEGIMATYGIQVASRVKPIETTAEPIDEGESDSDGLGPLKTDQRDDV